MMRLALITDSGQTLEVSRRAVRFVLDSLTGIIYHIVVARSRNEMTLNDSERSFVSQALVLAADKYVGFAVDCIGMAGGERLQQQFLRQAQEIRSIAIVIGDSDGMDITTAKEARREANADAAKITNQQFADTIRERLAKEKAVA